MVKYKKLGYNTKDEYEIAFLDTLLKTNHTYDYFVNWKKVFANLEENIVEINILNSLSNVESKNIQSKFREILKKYPETGKVIPTILAIREKNVDIFDIYDRTFKKINFSNPNKLNIDEIINFCDKTGLINLFSEISDLYTYLVGTEVGLDTNGRKNRSGHIFEKIVGELLENKIKKYPNLELVAEDSSVEIKRKKRADFVIYEKNSPKYIFECNFYSSTGSKPIETANAYIDLQTKITESNLTFIWVTDGLGWKKMFSTLKYAAQDIDYILNYKMLNNLFDKMLNSN